MRVVSICPSNTDIVCALGAADRLVGLDRSSDAPEVTHLPRMGPDLSVDVDAIAALRPDLVLSSSSVPGMEGNLARLDAAGLRHLVVDATSIDEVCASIALVGQALDLASHADALVARMRARLEAVRVHAGDLPRRPRVHLEWWPRPVIVPGRRCWTTDMITIAGGLPAFADLDVRSTPVEDTAVHARAPEMLLTCWCGVPHEKQDPARIARRPGWDALPGVRTGWLLAAEERLFGRPGPRLVDGVEWLHGQVSAWAHGGAA
jgi:iron complex transport system substrate-binding protein